MKTSRRTAMLSFILLAAASTASAQVAADVYLPKPYPPCNKYIDDCTPKPCINIYEGCDPMVPHPMKDMTDKTAGITALIGKGDFTKASESLDGLFTGAGSKAKGSESSAVAAGAWTVEPRTDRGLSKFQFAPRGREGRPLVERMDGTHKARIITVGASGAAAGAAGAAGSWAVGKVLDKAVDAVKQYNDTNKANQKSYEDGTAAWKRDQANKK